MLEIDGDHFRWTYTYIWTETQNSDYAMQSCLFGMKIYCKSFVNRYIIGNLMDNKRFMSNPI